MVAPSDALVCLEQAAARYQVPERLLWAIISKEGGKPGTQSRNTNGTLDLGPAQVNTSWLPQLTKFGITASHLTYDYCLNVGVSAWILSQQAVRKGDWFKATMAYHLGPNNWTPERTSRGYQYAKDVWGRWELYERAWAAGHYKNSGGKSDDRGVVPIQAYNP